MAHWTDISDDPNSPELLELRRAATQDTFGGFVPSRIDHLAAAASGKRVLDVGVVDHTSGTQISKGTTWLHGAIAAAAADCVGIDVLEEQIAQLRRQGFNVEVRDAVTADFEEPFDVIIAGEIIEHLGDPGGLMEMAKRNLRSDGVILITTPNPYFVERVWKNWRMQPTDSVDHVTLLWPSGIIELASRAGLQLSSWYAVELPSSPRALRAKVFVKLNWLWARLGMSPLYRSETLIYRIGQQDKSNSCSADTGTDTGEVAT